MIRLSAAAIASAFASTLSFGQTPGCPETVVVNGQVVNIGADIRRAGGPGPALQELRRSQREYRMRNGMANGDCSRFRRQPESYQACRMTEQGFAAAIRAAEACAMAEVQRNMQKLTGQSGTSSSDTGSLPALDTASTQADLRTDTASLRATLDGMDTTETIASAARELDRLDTPERPSREYYVHNSCAYSIQVAWCASPECKPINPVAIASGADSARQMLASVESLKFGRACQLKSGPSPVYWDRDTDQCWTQATGTNAKVHIPGQSGCVSVRWTE